jgi:hypothetical protein
MLNGAGIRTAFPQGDKIISQAALDVQGKRRVFQAGKIDFLGHEGTDDRENHPTDLGIKNVIIPHKNGKKGKSVALGDQKAPGRDYTGGDMQQAGRRREITEGFQEHIFVPYFSPHALDFPHGRKPGDGFSQGLQSRKTLPDQVVFVRVVRFKVGFNFFNQEFFPILQRKPN